MWIMIWAIVSANASGSVGTQEFPSKDACEAAITQLNELVVAAASMANRDIPSPLARCIQKATGKP